jgi:Concanavalin A-like lectin/glucanases superfamily
MNRSLVVLVLLAACAPQTNLAPAAAPAVQIAGGSLLFNGERPLPVVDFGNVPELTGVRSYSIQAWVKFASLATYATVFAQRQGDGDRAAVLQIGYLGENLATTVNAAYSQTPPHSVSAGSWYHVVVVYDASLADQDWLKLYVNGVRQPFAPGTPRSTPASTPTSATVFTVGAEYNQLTPITRDSSLVVPLAGNVSDVGIWINPLRGDEVAALYNAGVPVDPVQSSGAYVSSATLAHYWRLDDGSGSIARDSKGRQPGHVVNGAFWSTDAPSRSPAPPPPPRDVDAFQAVNGTACPGGQTLVSVAEAAAHRDAVCARLGRWDIVRLANGGSMDGPGYHCGTRDHDNRDLGGVLGKPGAKPTNIAR